MATQLRNMISNEIETYNAPNGIPASPEQQDVALVPVIVNGQSLWRDPITSKLYVEEES